MPNPRPHRDFGALAARAVHLAWWVQRPRGDHDFTHKEKTMRTTQLLTAAGLLALGACAPAISVRTALSPDASLTRLHTLREARVRAQRRAHGRSAGHTSAIQSQSNIVC